MTADANTNTFQGWDGTKKTSFSLTGPCRSIRLSLFLNMETEISRGNWAKIEFTGENIQQEYRRFPSFQSLLGKRQWAATPRFCCWQRLSAQEEKDLPVSIARRGDCLDSIQSRCSAPLRRATMNSVIKKGSGAPETVEAVVWRQCLSSRMSNVG